uniref:Uncharacterized protein n=1 Tax=Streptomyces rochei TaxID=1928 RepID=Q83WX3_STRRO|nr:hypothetical protein [Streptomyces rochei]BAK19908.1 hypothetical protein [Streptomyces rochei]
MLIPLAKARTRSARTRGSVFVASMTLVLCRHGDQPHPPLLLVFNRIGPRNPGAVIAQLAELTERHWKGTAYDSGFHMYDGKLPAEPQIRPRTAGRLTGRERSERKARGRLLCQRTPGVRAPRPGRPRPVCPHGPGGYDSRDFRGMPLCRSSEEIRRCRPREWQGGKRRRRLRERAVCNRCCGPGRMRS